MIPDLHVIADCRHVLRGYARTPTTTTIAIGVLTVGFAFLVAFFSLYADLTLSPHPGFDHRGRIATVGLSDGLRLAGIPYEFVQQMRGEMTSVEMAAMSNRTEYLVPSTSERLRTERVSIGFFEGLRPRLVLGTGFREEDHAPDAEPVVVISYQMWLERYGADRNVLGTTIELARGQSVTAELRIVGVMSEDLPGLEFTDTSIWIPLERAITLFKREDLPAPMQERLSEVRGTTYVTMRSGATVSSVARELSVRYGDQDQFRPVPGVKLDAIEGIVRDLGVYRAAKRQLEMFLVGSVLIALVAATNVSFFLLARAPSRRREFAIRKAVGATTARLSRQLAIEASLLVATSALLGVLLSTWLMSWLRGFSTLGSVQWRDVTLLDWRVLTFATTIVLALGFAVSLAPILDIKRVGIGESSRQIISRASTTQRVVVTVQTAIAGAFGGAGIALASYLIWLVVAHPGFERDERFLVETDGQSRIGGLAEYLVLLARQREMIEGIPGVEAVAFGSPVPGDEQALPDQNRRSLPEESGNVLTFQLGSLERRYIEILGLNLLYGRAPVDGEEHVVVVNETFALATWGRTDVVGERLPGALYWGGDGAEVVGVLRDVSFEHPSAAIKPIVFTPLGSPGVGPKMIVESRFSASQLTQALERLVSEDALEFSLQRVIPLKTLLRQRIEADRLRTLATITAECLVVILTAFGVYGTQRQVVTAGRREYAIRAAVGAGPGALGRLVVFRGLALGLPGIVAGTLLAFFFVAWLNDKYLSGLGSPILVSIAVTAGLVAMLIMVCINPARDVRQIQPARLLNEE